MAFYVEFVHVDVHSSGVSITKAIDTARHPYYAFSNCQSLSLNHVFTFPFAIVLSQLPPT